MRLISTQNIALWKYVVSLSFLFALCFSLAAQNGCEDDAGNIYGPYEELVVSDDPCENFTCIPSAFSFVWVSNSEYLDDCGGDEDEDDVDGEDWTDLIDWLEELCASNDPLEVDFDFELACEALALIEACDNGSEEACAELEALWDEFGDLWDDEEEDDGEEDDEEEDDGEEDDEDEGDEWEALIEWLEELCASDMPNDLGLEPDMACGILELIEACENGSEAACAELEVLLDEFEDLFDEGEDDDEEDDEEGDDDDEEDEEDDGEFDEEDLEALIEWLEELCADGMPNDWGIDPDMACGILELIAACDNGSEEACEELESIWEELEDFWDEDDEEDEEDEEDDEEDGEEDDEEDDDFDEEDWEALIEWLEELCADGMPNDWGIDPDMACGILELIAACDNGSEEACEELESIWEELEDFWDEDDEEDDEEDGEEDDEEDDDFDEEDWEALIEWLEELCADGMPNDWGIDPDMACGILELIAACEEGDEEACEELESIWEEFEDFWDEEDDEGEDCEVDFEFEQALDEDGVPLPYNIVAYVDEPEADTYYFWTFGDGNESDEPNPTHVYDEVGNYEVCLTVTLMDGNMLECTATYCDTLMIDMDGLVRQQMILNILFPGQTVNAVAEHEMALEVHPNPAADVVRIRVEGGIESAVVRTMDGRLVGRWASHGSQVLELSSAAWPTGSYMVVVKTATGVQRSRLLVQH